jgi:MFS family permease
MAERLKEKIIESDKMVDVVCGPDTYRDLPRLLEAVDYGQKGRKRKKGQNHSASALMSASNVIGTAVTSSLMDKKGRKSLLITSFMGMATSMLLLSLFLSWKALAQYSGTLAVLRTVLCVVSFSLGAGPVPALLLPF